LPGDCRDSAELVRAGDPLHLGDVPYAAALFFEKIMDELQNKSVLVVDDDPGMLRAMSKVLAGEGMQVTGVSDPVAVVKKLADSEKRFDVVITDLRMPVFSGRGVLALASALPELPVIILTAFGEPDVEAQALRLGAFAFLEKPVAAAQLIEVVKRALLRSPNPGSIS
jgi:DNA-binding NtrC family response regulator